MKSHLWSKWHFSKRERHAILFIGLCYMAIYIFLCWQKKEYAKRQLFLEKVYQPLLAFIPHLPDSSSTTNDYQKKKWNDNALYTNKATYQRDSLIPSQTFYPRASPYLSGPSRIEINSADSAEWNALSGIGDYMTKAIINYRNALGGFYSLDQLKNMKQMRPETFEKIKARLWCDQSKISPIPFNTADAYTLSKNPYLNYTQAKAIVAYREKHGLFTDLASLLKVGVLDDLTISNLRPYLAATFEQAATQ
jgi:competence protein ComEA